MNEEEFQKRLAEYIAGELDQQAAAAFRVELEHDEQRRKLADELQAAAAALETNTLSDEEARRRTDSLTFAELQARSAGAGWASHPAGAGHSGLKAVLRYAAVIILAFGAGFLARGWQFESRQRPPALAAVSESFNQGYAASYRQVEEAFPESSSFSRSLLMLARR
jgi:hypothetical protein